MSITTPLASSRCYWCGNTEPHGHTERELFIERHVRPAFEKRFVELYPNNQWWPQSMVPRCSGWGGYPRPDPDGRVPYAQYYGWNGTPRKKNFGGKDQVSDDNWCYRSYMGGRYVNPAVEMAWNVFEDGWLLTQEAMKQHPPYVSHTSPVEHHIREMVKDCEREDKGQSRKVLVHTVTYDSADLAAQAMGIPLLQLLERLNDPTLSEYNYA